MKLDPTARHDQRRGIRRTVGYRHQKSPSAQVSLPSFFTSAECKQLSTATLGCWGHVRVYRARAGWKWHWLNGYVLEMMMIMMILH